MKSFKEFFTESEEVGKSFSEVKSSIVKTLSSVESEIQKDLQDTGIKVTTSTEFNSNTDLLSITLERTNNRKELNFLVYAKASSHFRLDTLEKIVFEERFNPGFKFNSVSSKKGSQDMSKKIVNAMKRNNKKILDYFAE
jgi:hypothetical protein